MIDHGKQQYASATDVPIMEVLNTLEIPYDQDEELLYTGRSIIDPKTNAFLAEVEYEGKKVEFEGNVIDFVAWKKSVRAMKPNAF